MKLIKYFFLVPINPNKEWNNFGKDIDGSHNIKDELMALFVLYVMTILGYSYTYSLFFEDNLFSVDTSIELYLRSIAQLGLVILAFNINKKKVGFSAGNIEIAIYAIICYGLPRLLWSLVSIFWSPYDFLYSFIDFSLITFYLIPILIQLPPLLCTGILLTIGMTQSTKSTIYKKKWTGELGFLLSLTLMILGFNLVFNYIYSMVWSLFYMF